MTQANIEEMTSSENPEINRLLGVEGDLGAMFGLDAEWAERAIVARGNYGEIFAATIGEGTPLEHRPRPERPVDRRRPDLLAALPLRPVGPEGAPRDGAPVSRTHDRAPTSVIASTSRFEGVLRMTT